MDINRLREFLVLAEQLNYSKAANLLYITQPVLSRHIHDLEETFGGQLFERDTHKVHLTDFGKLCAVQLKDVVDSYEAAMINIRNAADTSNDTLVIGFLEYAVRPFLNQFASYFQAAHPTIDIEYMSGDLDDLTEAVLDNRMDLAFLTHIGSDPLQHKDLDSELIYEDRILAVFPPSHPLGSRDSIFFEELADHPHINYSKTTNPHTADFHTKLFENRGIHMNLVKEVSSLGSGLFYAKSGVGTFLIPQHLSLLAGDYNTVPIADDDCTIPLNIVWKKVNPKNSLKTYVHDFKLFYKNL